MMLDYEILIDFPEESDDLFKHVQLPFYIFELLPVLPDKEFKVVCYIARQTYGYHDKSKRLTVDDFINGRKKKDGSIIDRGVGFSRSTLFRCLNSLKQKGILIREIDNRNLYEKKIYYKLRTKLDPFDFDDHGAVISDYYFSKKTKNGETILIPKRRKSHPRDFRESQTHESLTGETLSKVSPVRLSIKSHQWDFNIEKETLLRKKLKEKQTVATLRCDDVCEDSSQPEEKPKPKKQPSDFDKSASEQLRKIVEETTGIKNERQSKSWPNNFRLLREIDKIEETKIQEILNWYQIVSPLKEKYTPVVRCGKTFREKFQKLNDALERWTRDNPKQIKKIKPKRVVVPLRPIRPREISIPQICFEKKSPFFRSYYQFLCERDMDRYFGRDDKTLKRELKQHQREFRKFLKERIDRSKLTLEEVQAAGLEFLIIDKKDPTSAS